MDELKKQFEILLLDAESGEIDYADPNIQDQWDMFLSAVSIGQHLEQRKINQLEVERDYWKRRAYDHAWQRYH
jgi:hypothetical protein